MSIPRLCVNADDFGLTAGVNRAIAELHIAGALPSATLMACGAAFDDAVAIARRLPSLDVGCHVVLVDGRPTAAVATVPTLVTQTGTLRESLWAFLTALQLGRIREDDIETEATAQIRALQRAGIAVSHIDTHKHTHLFPRVARPLLRAAKACGVGAVRNPFEPAWSAALTRGPLTRKLEVAALRSFRAAFLRLITEHGMATTDGCIGVSATGSLDEKNLSSLLENLPPGIWELVCHPGYDDEALRSIRTRLTTTRETERTALLDALPASNIQRLSFRDLC